MPTFEFTRVLDLETDDSIDRVRVLRSMAIENIMKWYDLPKDFDRMKIHAILSILLDHKVLRGDARRHRPVTENTLMIWNKESANYLEPYLRALNGPYGQSYLKALLARRNMDNVFIGITPRSNAPEQGSD